MALAPIPAGWRTTAFICAVAVVLWLSLAPTSALPQVSLWDKAEHALAYLALAGLGLTLFPHRPWRMAAGVVTLGVVVEVLQTTMGFGRLGDWRDALANGLGAALALGLFSLIRRAP